MLILGLGLGLYLFLQTPLAEVGIADNGDFLSRAGAVTVGPVDLPAEVPDGSELYSRRYVRFWIRDWRLETRWQRPRSSTAFLWYAAAGVGRLMGSTTLDLAGIATGFRLLSFLMAMVLVYGLARGGVRAPTLALLMAGVLLVHLDVETVRHVASFYEAAGFLPYLLSMLALLVLARTGRSRTGLPVLALGAAILAGTVQPQALPLLALTAVLVVWQLVAPRLPGARPWTIVICVLASAALTVGGAAFARQPWRRDLMFNGLFHGALTFSSDPAAHLQRFGLAPDAVELVGHSAWDSDGRRFMGGPDRNRLNFALTPSVYLHEPAALGRALSAMGDGLHAPIPLGRHEERNVDPAAGVPRSGPERTRLAVLYEACTTMFRRWLPAGGGFWAMVVLIVAGHLVACRLLPETREVSILAVLLLAAAGFSAGLSILGDGLFELPRHLYYARLLSYLGLLWSLPVAGQALLRTVKALAVARRRD